MVDTAAISSEHSRVSSSRTLRALDCSYWGGETHAGRPLWPNQAKQATSVRRQAAGGSYNVSSVVEWRLSQQLSRRCKAQCRRWHEAGRRRCVWRFERLAETVQCRSSYSHQATDPGKDFQECSDRNVWEGADCSDCSNVGRRKSLAGTPPRLVSR